MDWKLMFNAIVVFIPQLGEAINWIRKHVRKYKVNVKNNKLVIEIEIDDSNYTGIARKYLIDFLELITNKKPSNKN